MVEVQREVSEFRDFMRSYQVVIDGEVVGRLGAGGSQAFKVDPGSHELFLKIDWCRSEKLTVTVGSGQTVAFRCAPNGRPFAEFYWVSLGRHRYIKISEIGPEDAIPKRLPITRRYSWIQGLTPLGLAVGLPALLVAATLLVLRITDVVGSWAGLVTSGILIVFSLLGLRAESRRRTAGDRA